MHPQRTGELVAGALARETSQLRDPGASPGQALATSRHKRVVNKADLGHVFHIQREQQPATSCYNDRLIKRYSVNAETLLNQSAGEL